MYIYTYTTLYTIYFTCATTYISYAYYHTRSLKKKTTYNTLCQYMYMHAICSMVELSFLYTNL